VKGRGLDKVSREAEFLLASATEVKNPEGKSGDKLQAQLGYGQKRL
jgi:hypothetical protein